MEIPSFLKPALFEETAASFKICAAVFRLGADLQIFLFGGEVHLGAMVMASPQSGSQELRSIGHKDFIPAASMAARISSALGLRVGVSAGIHYDSLDRTGIEEILSLCALLTEKIIAAFQEDVESVAKSAVNESYTQMDGRKASSS